MTGVCKRGRGAKVQTSTAYPLPPERGGADNQVHARALLSPLTFDLWRAHVRHAPSSRLPRLRGWDRPLPFAPLCARARTRPFHRRDHPEPSRLCCTQELRLLAACGLCGSPDAFCCLLPRRPVPGRRCLAGPRIRRGGEGAPERGLRGRAAARSEVNAWPGRSDPRGAGSRRRRQWAGLLLAPTSVSGLPTGPAHRTGLRRKQRCLLDHRTLKLLEVVTVLPPSHQEPNGKFHKNVDGPSWLTILISSTKPGIQMETEAKGGVVLKDKTGGAPGWLSC
ncbi:uncharacterized protein LOC132023774 [Mustela nigripes]|uniref:uncharacterized protein LOC132023774 n=1 Tax=Mustela nigripes TaxID=77151 RepID=UPI002815CCA9|nr:uncharacterized protein LOC132023774 [Mustela nigripes]